VPVVHSDDIGHPMVAHQFFEDAQRALELLVGAGVTANNIAAVAITDGQRIAALAVRQDKPTLEVYGPYLVGAARLREVIRSNAMHATFRLGFWLRPCRCNVKAIVLSCGGISMP